MNTLTTPIKEKIVRIAKVGTHADYDGRITSMRE
jgi:hypothetical protein